MFGFHMPKYTFPGVPNDQLFDRVAKSAQAAEKAGFGLVTVMDHFYQIGGIGPETEPMMEAYTTLGYGIVDLDPQWRNISPIIGISGLFTFAWTTSALVGVVTGHNRLLEQLEIEREKQLELRAAARRVDVAYQALAATVWPMRTPLSPMSTNVEFWMTSFAAWAVAAELAIRIPEAVVCCTVTVSKVTFRQPSQPMACGTAWACCCLSGSISS